MATTLLNEWNLYHTDGVSNRVKGSFSGTSGNFRMETTKADGRVDALPLSIQSKSAISFYRNGGADLSDKITDAVSTIHGKNVAAEDSEKVGAEKRYEMTVTGQTMESGFSTQIDTFKGDNFQHSTLAAFVADQSSLLAYLQTDQPQLIVTEESTTTASLQYVSTNISSYFEQEAGFYNTLVSDISTDIETVQGLLSTQETDASNHYAQQDTEYNNLSTLLSNLQADADTTTSTAVSSAIVELQTALSNLKGDPNLPTDLDQLSELKGQYDTIKNSHALEFVGIVSNVFALYQDLAFLTDTQSIDFIMLDSIKDSFVSSDLVVYESASIMKDGIFQTTYVYNVTENKLYEKGTHRMPAFGNIESPREIVGITVNVPAAPTAGQTKMSISIPDPANQDVYEVTFSAP